MSEPSPFPQTGTIGGLHDFLLEKVLPSFLCPTARCLDLGAGSGALVARLATAGVDVVAADINQHAYEASAPFVPVDLNDREFARALGEQAFDLVTAIEVIEHVEAPLNFLCNARRLLKPDGAAVVTTPNVENLPARLKFLLTGKLRMMDARSERTHLSPIFYDLLTRQLLPQAGLELIQHFVYPPDDYLQTRRRYAWALKRLARFLPGPALLGDCQIFVLRPKAGDGEALARTVAARHRQGSRV